MSKRQSHGGLVTTPPISTTTALRRLEARHTALLNKHEALEKKYNKLLKEKSK